MTQLTPQQIVRRLRDLSSRMLSLGEAMEAHGGFKGKMDQHGKELAGASLIPRQWAKKIEDEMKGGKADERHPG